MKERLLVIETNAESDTVFLTGGPEELKEFAQSILNLVEKTKEGNFEHDHYTSPDWGGESLTTQKQSEDRNIVHHLKAYCIKAQRKGSNQTVRDNG
ncbi:Imm32 family immunity protein [Coraliomargarita akajimensis]|uniref:Uncharacterized protein n=1 Tax=Coraliomargarita akajimensis (strain DSM 45221 / IAM 15411 / JCM 23193 / KCTC 12865 / 04OKA010-24) TaxID=583355 RepID=D5ER70_CORAD|nr:Imm32 family immunity protein [Coraliomargarita akajimensis]ADE55914.1 hypothetical protein Caka_2901 [Coraliomargarita akajimensis DSM 45221]